MSFDNDTTFAIHSLHNSSFAANNLTRELISKVNIFLVSTDECTRKYSKLYCYYSSFLVLCGYLCNMSAIAFILHRITQLKTKFRNQYSLNLLWLCSILLIALIDIIEFIATGNGKVYSAGIIFIQCLTIVFCIVSIFY